MSDRLVAVLKEIVGEEKVIVEANKDNKTMPRKRKRWGEAKVRRDKRLQNHEVLRLIQEKYPEMKTVRSDLKAIELAVEKEVTTENKEEVSALLIQIAEFLVDKVQTRVQFIYRLNTIYLKKFGVRSIKNEKTTIERIKHQNKENLIRKLHQVSSLHQRDIEVMIDELAQSTHLVDQLICLGLVVGSRLTEIVVLAQYLPSPKGKNWVIQQGVNQKGYRTVEVAIGERLEKPLVVLEYREFMALLRSVREKIAKEVNPLYMDPVHMRATPEDRKVLSSKLSALVGQRVHSLFRGHLKDMTFHQLRTLYSSAAYNIYGVDTGVDKNVFKAEVLGHRVNGEIELASSHHYSQYDVKPHALTPKVIEQELVMLKDQYGTCHAFVKNHRRYDSKTLDRLTTVIKEMKEKGVIPTYTKLGHLGFGGSAIAEYRKVHGKLS